jgi:CIC family chloride channel protein
MAFPPSQPNLALDAPRLSVRFWAVIVLTGIGAGLAGALLMRLLFAVEKAAWSYASEEGDFLAAVSQTSAPHRLIVLSAAGVIAAGGSWILRRRRRNKGHAGDLAEAIWEGTGRIPAGRTWGNALLSIIVVGLGASLGREGAIKQTGAALASKLGDWVRLPAPQRRLVLACGAGAGIAAAYNVPFGGAIFAMEVLLGTLALPQVVPALVASLLGTAVSWLLLPNQPAYAIDVTSSPFAQIVWAGLAGPLLGIAAAGYVWVIGWADQKRPQKTALLFAPVLTLAVLGAVAIPFPQLLGNGKDLVERAFSNHLDLSLLLVLPVLKLAATSACLRSGIPGGLFTPTLTCGALLGGFLGRFAALFVPGLEPASCAIVGAGAFLASATGGPVSSILLLLELTRHIQPLLVPLMLAVAAASLTTRSLELRSIYTARFHPATRAATARTFASEKIHGREPVD